MSIQSRTTLLLTILVVALGSAPVGHSQLNIPASGNATAIDDLLALAGIQGNLGINLVGLEAPGESPASIVANARALLDDLMAAELASQALAAGAGDAGLAPTAIRGESLMDEVLGLYERLEITPTASTAERLSASVAAVSQDLQEPLASVVAAVNHAIDAVHLADHASALHAAGDLLRTIEALDASMSAGTSASCTDLIFEDPHGLIIVNGTCDHVYNEYRVIQIDLGGDDTYNNNAGGAELTNPIVFPSLHPEDVPVGPLLDALLPLGDIPSLLTLPGVVDALAADCTDADGCLVSGGINEAVLARAIPVAISVDLGSGADEYTSSAPYSQGAGQGAIGILYDAGGSDTYLAGDSSQGNGMALGVGILADVGAGSDNFQARQRSQGAGDGGYLLNLGADADTYTAAAGSQGSQMVPFPSGTYPSLLFDRAGDDIYTATGLAQGVGNLLVDGSGNDRYMVVGGELSLFDGMAQGASAAQEMGLLIDGAGDDHYSADIARSQGYAGGTNVGALLDFGGDDIYSATGRAQGVCEAPQGMGLLFDASGTDHYSAADGQGQSGQACLAALVDVSGNDVYVAGDESQGASVARLTSFFSGFGALVDGGGHDTYQAGSDSQGSASVGAALLLDADGTDSYTAGDASQGSGRSGAIGILIDGVQDVVGVESQASIEADDGVSMDGSAVVVSPGDDAPAGPLKADRYFAGHLSQGSGSNSGIGVLIDNDDETTADGGPHHSTFMAGNFSQGSGADGGVGLLVNREGSDDYIALDGAQGSATRGSLGLLLDMAGNDSYTVANEAASRGYGESTPQALAFGLLVDAGGQDAYSAPGIANNDCEEKGNAGLTVDAQLPFVNPNCAAVIAGAADAFAQAAAAFAAGLATGIVTELLETIEGLITTIEDIIASNPGGPSPCTGTEYFCHDAENGAAGMTTTVSPNRWQLVDQDQTPSASGINAASGTHYWYVGAAYPGITYHSGGNFLPANLRTPDIVLPASATPMLTFEIAGESEEGFDQLSVQVTDSANAVLATLDTFDAAIASYTTQSYNLTAYAGQTIRIQFSFTSDEILEIGPGWNIDDIRVA